MIKSITTDELQTQLENETELKCIDVREDNEVLETGIIPQAEHIKMGIIPFYLDKLDKNAKYVIICRSGKRSLKICEIMDRQGFEVLNLTGGMLDWKGPLKKY
ncbi:MAG: rhodanese-like protein [Bacillales bacterium]|jgi:rhodanese-related sulfurtransferase|nr:rhodanese-like protein [Bacillales bacterium]